jgi:hypothetical protein
MSFSPDERKALLAVKGVGPTVVARLEQIGFETLTHLSKANALDVVSKASEMLEKQSSSKSGNQGGDPTG